MQAPNATAPALFVRHYQKYSGEWQQIIGRVLQSQAPTAQGISSFRYRTYTERTNPNEFEKWFYENYQTQHILHPHKTLSPAGVRYVWTTWCGRAVTPLAKLFNEADRSSMTLFFMQFLNPQKNFRSLADFVNTGDIKILDEAVKTRVLQLFRKRLKAESRLLDPKHKEKFDHLNARIQTLNQTIQALYGSMPSWAQVEQQMGTLPEESEKQAQLRYQYTSLLKEEASVPPYALAAPSRVYFHQESVLKELETLSSLPNFKEIAEEVAILKKVVASSNGSVTLADIKDLKLTWMGAVRSVAKNLGETTSLKAGDLDLFDGRYHFNRFFDEIDKLQQADFRLKFFQEDLSSKAHVELLQFWKSAIQDIRGKEAKPLPTFAELTKEFDFRAIV